MDELISFYTVLSLSTNLKEVDCCTLIEIFGGVLQYTKYYCLEECINIILIYHVIIIL